MPASYTFKPVGLIRTPHDRREGMPIQSARTTTAGRVEIEPEYAEGLDGLEDFSHIILLYVFHRSPGPRLTVRPFLDDASRGVFATRHPDRPNPIGLSVVELVRREGNILHVSGVDMVDGSPLLDVKPYVPQFDHHEVTRTGWLAGQEDERPWRARFDEQP